MTLLITHTHSPFLLHLVITHTHSPFLLHLVITHTHSPFLLHPYLLITPSLPLLPPSHYTYPFSLPCTLSLTLITHASSFHPSHHSSSLPCTLSSLLSLHYPFMLLSPSLPPSLPATRYENPEIALNCGMMLRECVRHESLCKIILYSEEFYYFFRFVEVSTFDIASDAFTTFKVSRDIISGCCQLVLVLLLLLLLLLLLFTGSLDQA